jgi:hypothetical protein
MKTISELKLKNLGGVPGEKVELKATLTAKVGGSPLSGRQVSFEIGGHGSIGSAATDAQGLAKRSFTIPDNWKQESRQIKAAFAGDTSTLSASDTATMLVVKAITEIQISDILPVYNEGSNPGPGVPVFNLHLVRKHDGKRLPGTMKVTVDGAFYKNVNEPLTTLMPPPGNPTPWNVYAQFDGDDSNMSTSASKTLKWPK